MILSTLGAQILVFSFFQKLYIYVLYLFFTGFFQVLSYVPTCSISSFFIRDYIFLNAHFLHSTQINFFKSIKIHLFHFFLNNQFHLIYHSIIFTFYISSSLLSLLIFIPFLKFLFSSLTSWIKNFIHQFSLYF